MGHINLKGYNKIRYLNICFYVHQQAHQVDEHTFLTEGQIHTLLSYIPTPKELDLQVLHIKKSLL
ncbi:MAG: hypothetical protein CMJ25_03925 [Phycisphaerae bacterium]|nr:hypothetical protein [Phycisphaerae bacterium]